MTAPSPTPPRPRSPRHPRFRSAMLLGAAALSILGALIVASCAESAKYRTDRSAVPPATATEYGENTTGRWSATTPPPPPSPGAPIGIGQNSMGVTLGEAAADSAAGSQATRDTLNLPLDSVTLAKRGDPKEDYKPALTPGAGGGGRDPAATTPSTASQSPASPGGVRPMAAAPAENRKIADKSARAAAAAIQLRGLAQFPGSLPALDEEIWVIQKFKPNHHVPQDDLPGTGSMIATSVDNKADAQIPVPLKHTAVHANISGNIASVSVTQQFANPFSSKIEAVYVFPLPENAAINEFVMTVGERHIRGIIRDREEARQIYEAARAQGRVAALMEQDRPNIFTQKVANIEPGKAIDIAITYFNTLAYVDGEFEFVFPMVVGPRFNPPGFYDGVGAVSRQAAASSPDPSGQPVNVAYVKPNERSGHDIDITVDINAGMPLGKIRSDSHVIDIKGAAAPGQVAVSLSSRDRIPNKDFVLRYRVASDGADTRSGIVTYTDKDGQSYFSALVVPPTTADKLGRAPVELVFVLDCSGSMQGRPIEQVVAAVTRGLKRLQPDDTFQIINFANTASQLGTAPIAATDSNVAKGIKYTQSLFAEGGTMMINGIRASLDFPHDPRRLRFVCFLTDGYIGNEAEILGEIQARLGPSRIFSFGVGSSVNRYLIDAMGKIGRGCVAHVAAGDSPDQFMDRFFDRISRPAFTDLSLDLGDLAGSVEEVFPRNLPDLFPGRAMVINGKLKPGTSLTSTVIRVRGHAGGPAGPEQAIEIPLTMHGIVPPATSTALPQIWARSKIADIADYASGPSVAESASLIKDISLRYNLMSSFTSFVAVDSTSQTSGTSGTTVVQPVPTPEGVTYDTTVSR